MSKMARIFLNTINGLISAQNNKTMLSVFLMVLLNCYQTAIGMNQGADWGHYMDWNVKPGKEYVPRVFLELLWVFKKKVLLYLLENEPGYSIGPKEYETILVESIVELYRVLGIKKFLKERWTLRGIVIHFDEELGAKSCKKHHFCEVLG